MAAAEGKFAQAKTRFAKMRAAPARLDLTRGKPCAEQLALADEMLRCVAPGESTDAAGNDARNYGVPQGVAEARELFGALLEVPAQQIVLGENSSLALMYDALAAAVAPGGPWREGGVLLCPAPGYDRHFALTEHLGLQMEAVDIHPARGLDVEAVARRARDDARVKGIWIVPKYQNPTGYTLQPEEVRALAQMKCAAADFRIFWDNAYAVHHLGEAPAPLENILHACAAAGCAERALLFASTSKITFAGGGVAAFGGSPQNVEWHLKQRGLRTIGGDKINQLRHARFFGGADGLLRHMQKHAAILRPKFAAVQRILSAHLGGDDGGALANWSQPRGGYFVSLNVQPGLARRVCALAAEAGVALTPAGATFPYGKDPRDSNIRIAPTMPAQADLERALEVLATAVLCAAAEVA